MEVRQGLRVLLSQVLLLLALLATQQQLTLCLGEDADDWSAGNASGSPHAAAGDLEFFPGVPGYLTVGDKLTRNGGDNAKTAIRKSSLLDCLDTSDEPWDHPVLGSFAKDKAYCDHACNRTVCCRPQPVDDLSVHFILMKPSKEVSSHEFDDAELGNYLEQANVPVVFISMGLQPDHKTAHQLPEIQRAYAEKGFNSVILDWAGQESVAQVLQNLRVVAAMLGSIISEFDLEKRTVCAGFGLGAHICGEAGRYVQRDGKKIAKCHMLDPSGAYFDGCDGNVRQNKKDCKVVLTIHTSQAPTTTVSTAYGTTNSSGSCDFWVNTGNAYKQPNCKPKIRGAPDEHNVIGACAHFRSLDYYLAQIKGDCSYQGQQATMCGSNNDCVPLPDGKPMQLPPFDNCKSSMTRNFLVELTTNPKAYPYC